MKCPNCGHNIKTSPIKPKRASRLPPGTDTSTIREISVKAEVDPRTVERLLRGEQVRGIPTRRITRALQALKLEHLLPKKSKTPA